MKTKKASKTNTRSRIIFFAIALTYTLLLGLYLKEFLVLSPVLLTFYLLSALPTLFFVLKIRSTPMRTTVLIVLFFVMVMSIVSALSCRSQNIPCYVVDGTPYDRSTQDHTWNRVYYDGCWWDLDVTNDISCTASGESPYGFRELTNVYDSDKDYYITNIY